MELLTDNLNICKHYQVAVLEHPPSPDVSIIFFRLFHSFESVGLLEIRERLWQAKAIETTRAEMLFSASLSRKPSHVNFLIHSN